MTTIFLKGVRLALAGVHWTAILVYGLSARGITWVDVALSRRTPKSPFRPNRSERPHLRVVR